MQIDQLVSAESGWKAVFEELDGGQTTSRILGWAITDGGEELVGVIVDPSDPARIVPSRCRSRDSTSGRRPSRAR